MTPAIVYAVISMACYGLADFIYKLAASASIRADRLLMVQSWIWWLLFTPYAAVNGTLVIAPAAAWGLLSGATNFIGIFLFIRSLTSGSISTNAPIFRLNFVVTVFLVIAFLGEPLTATKMAGLALALTATWLLMSAGSGTAAAPVEDRRRSLIQVAVATGAFGASNYFQAVGLRYGAVPDTLAVAGSTLFAPLATAVTLLSDGKPRSSLATLKYATASALAMIGASVLLLHGMALGQASVLVPVSQMGFVLSAPLGVVVLRERMTVRKACGLAAAVLALVVLIRS